MNPLLDQPIPTQVAFVFDNVAHYQDLVAAFLPGVEVHVLDGSQDGLAQMAAILEGRTGVAALHVIGHGAEGSLNLGSVTLDSANLNNYSQVLGEIGHSLAPGGDILLYGCDVGAGAAGASFVGHIAQLTGADVAASTNLTGGAQLGGDWTLEYSTGLITSAGAFDAAAVHNLDTLLVSNGVQDVTPTMNTSSFASGFTLTTAQNVLADTPNHGIYFDTLTESESFTVAADGTQVGTFDLTALTLVKAFTFGQFDITITGHRPDTTTATLTIKTAYNASTFTAADGISAPNFSGLTGLSSFDVTITGTTTDLNSGATPSDLTLDSFSVGNIVSPNVVPTFTNTSTPLNTTEGSIAVDVAALLHVSDTDSSQTMTWSQNAAPSHGVLSISGATASSGTTNITPGGAITYTPTPGFAGTDSFSIKVADGAGGTATRTVSVNVTPSTPSAPALTAATDSGTNTSDKITNATSVAFSGTGTTGDSTSSVQVFIDKNNNGTYDAGTDVSGTVVMSNGAWTTGALDVSGLTSGSYNVYAQSTAGGLTGARSTAGSLTIDRVAPTVSIGSDLSALHAGQTATITFTFSEDPGSSFSWDGTSGDVAVTGGTLSAISGSGATRTAVFTPTANTNSGTASITIASGAYTDAAGNNGGAGTTPGIGFDTLAPTAPSAPALASGSDSGIASDNITKVVTPTLTGTAEANATVKLYDSDGTTVLGTGTADGAGNWSIATGSLADGAHNITAKATDAAGNVSSASTALAVTIDTAAPAAPSAPALASGSNSGSTADAITSVVNPTLTGTAEANATVKLYDSDGTTVLGTGAADGTGHWSIATGSLADGAHNITAKATDAAGNVSSASAALAVTIDTTAPTVSISSDLSALHAGQTATIAFTFSEDPGSSFTWDGTSGDVAVAGGTLSAISGSGTTRTAVFTPTANTNSGTASVTIASGAYTDAAGNNGGAGTTPSITFDTLAPTVSISSDASSLHAGQTATIAFTFSEDPGSSFSWDGTSGDVAVAGGTLSAISGSGTTRTAVFTPLANTNGGTASITVASGAYTDAAGNNGGAGTTPSITFDTLAPTAPSAPALASGSDSGIASDNITNVVTPTLTGTAEANATVKLYDGATEIGSGTADGTGHWSITTGANLAQGAHNITAKATDAAGNASSLSSPLAVTIDTTAPTIAFSSDKAALKAGDAATITFTFSEDPGAGFTAASVSASGGTLSNMSGSGTTRSATFTPDANANGTAAITVDLNSYHDAAGNTGGNTASVNIPFDTAVPSMVTMSDAGALKIGQTANITFIFSEDPGASFADADVTVTGGTLSVIAGTGIVRSAVFTPDANTNGGTGTIKLTGSYTDAAGNVGTADGGVTVTFDTLAPKAPSTPALATASDSGTSHADNLTKVSAPVLAGTAEAGATVKLYDGATLVGTGAADGAGNWTITTDRLADGVHSIAAAATDAAGNAGAASAAQQIAIDLTAPGAPTLALAGGAPSGSTVNDGTVKVSGLEGGASWEYSLDGGARWQAGSGDKFVAAGDIAYTAQARQTDAAGNVSAPSPDVNFTLDTVGPTATVSISDTTLTSGATATVTIAFSESVAGFDLSDISAGHGTLSNLASSDGGRTWTATMTPQAGVTSDTNVISVNNAGVQDLVGNPGAGSGSSANYTVLTGSVGAGIELSDANLGAGETAVVTIHFSEPVHDFTLADLTAQNGKLSDLSSSDGGRTWTAKLTPTANLIDSTNVITLDNGGVTGVQGEHGQGVSTSANYGVDTARPTASVSMGAHILAPGASTSVQIKFSEAVIGLDGADIAISHATLSGLASSDGGVTWSATMTADQGDPYVEPGSIAVDTRGVHDAAGNTGQDTVGVQFVVVPGNAAVADIDGTPVLKEIVTDPTTGATQQVITIPEVMPNRVDDPSTTYPTLADIALASNPNAGGAPILTVSLLSGTSLRATGSVAPLSVGSATTDLVGRIGGTAATGSGSQADMASHAQDFLSTLGAGATVATQTIVPLLSADAAPGQPITISGAPAGSGGPQAPVVGLVIDGGNLPAGTTIHLDNVQFAAVTGNVRVVGGEGENYVVGDGASQTIYLGPGDDVLNGGAGNDFIGSAGGNDRLNGGDGNDLVAGGIGNDTVSGDAGNDMLNGGRSTVGDWSFHISSGGAISATHSNAPFTANGSETVQAAELDSSLAELRFLQADPQKVEGIALLYAGLDRAPDLGGLSFWATGGASLQDVANGILSSAEFGGSALGQSGDVAFVTGMYQHVLGRAPEQAGLDYWVGRLEGSDGKPAGSRADVLVAVALSEEHKAEATTADGITIGQASVQREGAWFTGSGNDVLDGGPGSDLLVGGDGFDTVVYGGDRSQYHILIGADDAIRVLDAANGDVDTLSGIEAARFKDGTVDIGFLNGNPAQLERVGLMYETVLGRAADLPGLAWWTSKNIDAAQLAQGFTATAEYQARYGGMSDAAFVQALYANSALDASAAGGEQSWDAYLAHHSRAELIAAWIGQDEVIHAQFGTTGLWLA